jgi:hypothetical protein
MICHLHTSLAKALCKKGKEQYTDSKELPQVSQMKQKG